VLDEGQHIQAAQEHGVNVYKVTSDNPLGLGGQELTSGRTIAPWLEVADYFYADLFERNPGYRSLFPASMARQHKVLIEALA
jgi:hypothetical protein